MEREKEGGREGGRERKHVYLCTCGLYVYLQV